MCVCVCVVCVCVCVCLSVCMCARVIIQKKIRLEKKQRDFVNEIFCSKNSLRLFTVNHLNFKIM